MAQCLHGVCPKKGTQPPLRSGGFRLTALHCGVLTLGPSASPPAMAITPWRSAGDGHGIHPTPHCGRGAVSPSVSRGTVCETMRAGTASPFTSVRLQTSLRRMRTFPRYGWDQSASSDSKNYFCLSRRREAKCTNVSAARAPVICEATKNAHQPVRGDGLRVSTYCRCC